MNTWFPCWTNPFFHAFLCTKPAIELQGHTGSICFFNRNNRTHHITHIIFFLPPPHARISPSWVPRQDLFSPSCRPLRRRRDYPSRHHFDGWDMLGLAPNVVGLCWFIIWFARIHFYPFSIHLSQVSFCRQRNCRVLGRLAVRSIGIRHKANS